MDKIRLQKYFSDCGVMSRRAAEEEIAAGHVKVNGQTASLGDKVEPGTDRVVWNGRGITYKADRRRTVVAVNKPRGYVCTAKDEKGRKQVTDLTRDLGIRLYPVGRLDMASEGLILLTDDGDLANLLTHPRHSIPKVYRVSVRGELSGRALEVLRSPIEMDGSPIEPVEVTVLENVKSRDGTESSKLEMTLYEGRNRQIRRMCEAAGLEVARLRRVRIGNISVNGIAPGTYRVLSDSEVAALRRDAREPRDGGETDIYN